MPCGSGLAARVFSPTGSQERRRATIVARLPNSCRLRHDRVNALNDLSSPSTEPRMQSNWFAAHVDLLLYLYGAIAIALVVWTLWRARQRKHAAAQRDAVSSRSD